MFLLVYEFFSFLVYEFWLAFYLINLPSHQSFSVL